MIDWLHERFRENADCEAIVWKDSSYSYGWLSERLLAWRNTVRNERIGPGSVVVLEADFSPNAVAALLALIENACVVVPLTQAVGAKRPAFTKLAQAEFTVALDDEDMSSIKRLDETADHAIYAELRASRRPGLVLFSSGSTGESKASVHDLATLLEKFKVQRHRLRTIPFLLFDHIGGVNTLLYTLSNGGCLVVVDDRGPDGVLSAVERHQVELLPTSPTFINLVLLSEAYKRHDLSSLKLVTYGTEPMPESTLTRFHELFPAIRLLQTYGLSEVGILRSKSRDSGSTWVKVGGEGFDTRVIDGRLQIKARSAMLGYLNAPSPFTEDGWLDTGDVVEVDGEYVRFLGRESEIINVGGEKVYPAEVESVIQEMDEIAEVTVFGESNAIVGNIVCARVRLSSGADHSSLSALVRRHCRSRLQSYKVPAKVVIDSSAQHSARFKKIRRMDKEQASESPASDPR